MLSGKLERDIERLSNLFDERGLKSAYVKTYGCQQNLSDSEKIKGILSAAGCVFSESAEDADIVVFNTCAVRENAESKVFGHLGELKKVRMNGAGRLVALGGCMAHQPHIARRIKESFPYVDVIFNTNALENLPGLILEKYSSGRRIAETKTGDYAIEEIPVCRENGYRALLPIMYGCENYCSYCVVPFVRGKERSRKSEDVVSEFRGLVAAGYKDIMLLGQNVNSYGANRDENVNFSGLLRELNDVDGEFVIRFMTSHPKDAGTELFETVAECSKVSRNIHLPVQSGSDRILRKMNRGYSRESYLSLIDEARKIIPGVTFTSDVIIGFPGETEGDFLETVSLIERARFYSLFTFIYSRREGTKAALLEDAVPHKEKAERLIALTKIQDEISRAYDSELSGKVLKGVAVRKTADGLWEVRLDNNSVAVADGTAVPGAFCRVAVIGSEKNRLRGIIET